MGECCSKSPNEQDPNQQLQLFQPKLNNSFALRQNRHHSQSFYFYPAQKDGSWIPCSRIVQPLETQINQQKYQQDTLSIRQNFFNMDSIRYGNGGSRYDGFNSQLNSKQNSPLRSNHRSYSNTARLRQSLNIQRVNQTIFNPSNDDDRDYDDSNNNVNFYKRKNTYFDGKQKGKVQSPNTYCNTLKNYDNAVFGSPETIDVVQNYCKPNKFRQIKEDLCMDQSQDKEQQKQIKIDTIWKSQQIPNTFNRIECNSYNKWDYEQLQSHHHIPQQFESNSQKDIMMAQQLQQKSTAIDTDRHKQQNRYPSDSIKQAIKYAPNSVPNRSNQYYTSLRNKSSTPFMFGTKKQRAMILIERSLNDKGSQADKIQSSSKIFTGAMDMDIQLQNDRQRTQSQYFMGNHHSISSEQMVFDVFS